MGTLYVVSTPIGNLEDTTLRALRILKEVDLILCEDTRQTLKLLNHYEISKPLVSYFQHSSDFIANPRRSRDKLSKVEYIIEQLKQGKKIALVTDAGTPGISDPGNKLISLIVEKVQMVEIVPIPGPNAAIAALSASGFPADKFIFMGFPPHKKKREKFFKEIGEAKYTIVLYESPYRILKTLEQLKSLHTKYNILDTKVVVCRELTKKFETIYRGNIAEVIKRLENDKNNLKGEFVIIISK